VHQIGSTAVDLIEVRVGLVIAALSVLVALGAEPRAVEVVQLVTSALVADVGQIEPVLLIVGEVDRVLATSAPIIPVLLEEHTVIGVQASAVREEVDRTIVERLMLVGWVGLVVGVALPPVREFLRVVNRGSLESIAVIRQAGSLVSLLLRVGLSTLGKTGLLRAAQRASTDKEENDNNEDHKKQENSSRDLHVYDCTTV